MKLENVHEIMETLQVTLDNLRSEFAVVVEEAQCEEQIGDLVTQAGIIPLALIEKMPFFPHCGYFTATS
jgi:division protein CdvB (Snf7/Vps24/ESCRT-III family)